MTAYDDGPAPFDPNEEPPEYDWGPPLHQWDDNPFADVPWPNKPTPEEQEAIDLEHARNWTPPVQAPATNVFNLDALQARRRAELAATRQELEHDGKVMRHYSAAELVAMPRKFEWLARGWLTRPTYGMVAGEKKTLKTYVTLFMNLALAAGQPIFGHFDVDHPVPVISYIGEGGRVPYTNRLERVARALDINLDDVPFITTFEAPPISSEKFQLTLRHDLDEWHPGLVNLDPLYAFHGTGTDARNLHDEGALLTSMSNPCTEAGACLNVVNHFNKTGSGKGLDRITMSGAAEWVDTWTLISHRQAPDVENGTFYLLLEIGSRQWGGTTWDLDLHIGRFNPDTGEHDGEITWDLRHHDTTTITSNSALLDKIIEVITDDPLSMTKTEILDIVGGRRDARNTAFEELVTSGQITWERVSRQEQGVQRTRKMWRPAGTDPHTWDTL